MSEIGYQGEVVAAKETTWGTAVQGGANSKFPFTSFNDGKNVQFVEDNNIRGSAFRRLSKQGTKLFQPEVSGDAFYAAGLPLFLAVLAGSDAVTDVDTAAMATVGADHLYVPAPNNASKSLTLARKLKDVNTVKEYPGFKPMRIELSITQGGQLKVVMRGSAQNLINTSTTNTVASIEAATIDAPVELIMYADMTVWLADQDGAAFDDDDKIHVEALNWAWERGYKIVPGPSSQLIREQVASGFFATEFGMTLPFLEDLAYETDLLNGQVKRAKVQFSGPLLTGGDAGQNNELNLFLPALQIRTHTDDVSGPDAIAQGLTLEAGEAASAPNDMNSEVVPHAIVRNELQTAYV